MKIYQKVLLVFALLIGTFMILYEINGIRVTKTTDTFGPKLLPGLLCVFIFISSSIIIICSKKSIESSHINIRATIRSMFYFVFLFAYFLLMKYFGFILASIFYLEVSVLILGGRNVSKKIYVFFILIIVVLALYFVFGFFNMNLPKGWIMGGNN